MIGVIRVFTTDSVAILEEHGKIISNMYEVMTISKCIPAQPLGVFDDQTEETSIPKIIQLGKEFEASGSRVLVVSCAADPGVKRLRENVSIPVVGAGSAASYAALALGIPVGLLGISADAPTIMEKLLGDQMVGYVRPEGVSNTTDLMKPNGHQKGLEAARSLLSLGAKGIVLACTGFSTIGLAAILRKELNVPVIDAVEAEGLFASFFWRQTSAQHKEWRR